MTQGKAFKPNVLIIESARSSIDIATGYKTECYFSEDNTTALTEYEIARRLQIHVSSVNHHFDICSIQEDCKEEFIKNKIKIINMNIMFSIIYYIKKIIKICMFLIY